MSAEVHRTTRITRRFAELRDSGEMGIVAYITAGDPSFAATLKFVLAMAEAGADVIELGVPFSDPLADGPTIQRASERALKNGATLARVIDLVREIRKANSLASEVPIVLFSYYAVLNLGLLLIAWFKAWRPLNVAGFLFTFVIGTAWGVLRYRPELFASTEPFLILFFVLYVAIAVLFAERQPPELRGYVDGTLVFGTPLVAFGLQSALLFERRFALAYSALFVSGFYLALAWTLHRRRRDTQRLLTEAFMALGVLFLTLAVPLGLDGRWSSATWSVEGAGLLWIGCRQGRRLPRAFGALLQIAGGVIFWTDRGTLHDALPVLNSACLGGVLVSAASVFCAATLLKARERLSEYEAPLAPVLFFWGLLWWLFTGLTEIQRSVPDRYDAGTGLVFVAATAFLCSEDAGYITGQVIGVNGGNYT